MRSVGGTAKGLDLTTYLDDQSAGARIARVFENLDANHLDALEQVYAADAWFKDPFNDVRGLVAVRAIFAHMFVQLDRPRFRVLTMVEQGGENFLTWNLDFYFKAGKRSALQTIHGASHLQIGSDGRIVRHRDYWDAAEELYEKLPLVAGLMRFFKRRVGA